MKYWCLNILINIIVNLDTMHQSQVAIDNSDEPI